MREQITVEKPPEKAILVGVHINQSDASGFSLDESLDELELLAETAGLETLGRLTQNLDHPNPKTFIGSGKLEELQMLAEELDATVVVFDDELSPRHLRELEKALGTTIRVLDRTSLILDIFAMHAQTREGMTQVELAQLEYRLPRLTRAWTHLARQSGGGGGRTGSVGGVGLRGPGEQQLEVDRREINRKIVFLKEQLEKIKEQRERHRDLRRKSHIPVVSLVGYTNAGKSTLLNRLTNAGIYVADKLFATLDPTTRQLELPSGQTVLLTDTVGFVQKLPTQLVAAFRATLEEITDAQVLINVVDVSHPAWQLQKQTVLETLGEIGAGEIPVLTAYNKVDLLSAEEQEALENWTEPDALFMSALTGEGIDRLLEKISSQVMSTYEHVNCLIPYSEGQLVSLFHEKGHVESITHENTGQRIRGWLPKELVGLFRPYTNKKPAP